MIIDFKDAVEGEFYNVEESIPLDDSLTGSRGGRFLSPATLKGWYTFSENTLAVNCVLTVEAIFDCDRCGAPTTVKYKVPVEETFLRIPRTSILFPTTTKLLISIPSSTTASCLRRLRKSCAGKIAKVFAVNAAKT